MYLVVVGAGPLGDQVVSLATKARYNVAVIEQDSERSRRVAQAHGAIAICGDATKRSVLEQAKVGEASAIVVTPRNPGVALVIAASARETGVRRILAVTQSEEHREVLGKAGVLTLESPYELAAQRLFWWVERPEVRDILRLANGQLEVFELHVEVGSEAVDAPVSAVQDKTKARVACLRRDNRYLLPSPSTLLEAEDRATLFAPAEEVEKIVHYFRGRESSNRRE